MCFERRGDFKLVLTCHPQASASASELTQYSPLDRSVIRGIYVSVFKLQIFRPYVERNDSKSRLRPDGVEQF